MKPNQSIFYAACLCAYLPSRHVAEAIILIKAGRPPDEAISLIAADYLVNERFWTPEGYNEIVLPRVEKLLAAVELGKLNNFKVEDYREVFHLMKVFLLLTYTPDITTLVREGLRVSFKGKSPPWIKTVWNALLELIETSSGLYDEFVYDGGISFEKLNE